MLYFSTFMVTAMFVLIHPGLGVLPPLWLVIYLWIRDVNDKTFPRDGL